MKKLTDFNDDTKFYRGTIIVLKGADVALDGTFDIKYCMVESSQAHKFVMVDLYRRMGDCILLDLKTNVEGDFAVNKNGIKEWATLFFNTFFTEIDKAKWIPMLDEILYIESIDDYFQQAYGHLFVHREVSVHSINKLLRQVLVEKYVKEGVQKEKIIITKQPSTANWSLSRKCLVGENGVEALEIIDEEDGSKRLSFQNNVWISMSVRTTLTKEDVDTINNSNGIVCTSYSGGFRYGFIPS
jgi:hypothetical protein